MNSSKGLNWCSLKSPLCETWTWGWPVLIINWIALGNFNCLLKFRWSRNSFLTFYPPQCFLFVHVMANQSSNQSNNFYNPATAWYVITKKGRSNAFLKTLTCQEAVHAERDVVHRNGRTGSRSIFSAEIEKEPVERQRSFNISQPVNSETASVWNNERDNLLCFKKTPTENWPLRVCIVCHKVCYLTDEQKGQFDFYED